MMDWLLGNWTVFGFDGQNWMWVFALALLIYIATLVCMRRRERPR